MFKTIKSKLTLSFLAVIILIGIQAGYSIFATNKTDSGFNEFKDKSEDTSLASTIKENMLTTRLITASYFSDENDKQVDAFNKFYKKTKDLIAHTKTEITSKKRLPMILKVEELLEKYKANFIRGVELTRFKNDTVKNVLDVNGAKMGQNLVSIIKDEEQKGHHQISAKLIQTTNTLLFTKVFTMTLLETKKKEDYDKLVLQFNTLEKEIINIKKIITKPTSLRKLDNILASINIIKPTIKKVFDAISQKKEVLAKLFIIGPQIGELTQKIKSSIKEDEDKIGLEVSELNSKIKTLIIIVSSIILALAIFLAIFLPKSINKLINTFQIGLLNFFKYLNKEKDNVQPINLNAQDELSQMAKVVNENIEKTKKTLEEDKGLINESIAVLSEFEQGDLTQRLSSNVSNPSLNQLKDVLNKMADHLEANINNILNVISEYSSYNYTNSVSTNSLKEHFLKLADGVNQLGKATTQMLVENKENGLTLGETSDILLKNVDTLNKNSNDAAAAIEETAAAIEEITSNIVSNSDNMTKMVSLAQDLTNSINTEKDLANKTTKSMDEINEQVSSINEAITVIDQIAFQTNILSLNAAVEAATAGEAGKGFAVVAQEVRNLAARSAEAAKDIKDIVEKATIKANEGKEISAKMIEGYGDINNNVSQASEVVKQVEISSQEQKTGIEQISDAINSLDKQTQENASIAMQTHDIASQTDDVAKLILEKANEKEFVGKDQVKAKVKQSNNVKIEKKETPKVKEIIEELPEVKEINNPTKVEPVRKKEFKAESSSVSSDDEWESF